MEEMPVFVKIDEYKQVLDIMNVIKGKIGQARETLAKINQIKNEEDAELEQWKNSLDEAERKIEFVDKTLFEPANM